MYYGKISQRLFSAFYGTFSVPKFIFSVELGDLSAYLWRLLNIESVEAATCESICEPHHECNGSTRLRAFRPFIQHVANMRLTDGVGVCLLLRLCMQFHNRDAPNAPQLLQTPCIMRPSAPRRTVDHKGVLVLQMKNDLSLELRFAYPRISFLRLVALRCSGYYIHNYNENNYAEL